MTTPNFRLPHIHVHLQQRDPPPPVIHPSGGELGSTNISAPSSSSCACEPTRCCAAGCSSAATETHRARSLPAACIDTTAMAHHNAAPPQGHGEALHGLATTPENRSRTSYETGESSTTGSLLDATPPIDDSLDLPPNSSPGGVQPGSAIPAPTRQGGSTRRKLRHRSGAGFLLQDKVAGDGDLNHRRSVRDASHHPRARASPAPWTPESPRSNAARDNKLKVPSDTASPRQNTASPQSSRSKSSSGSKNDAAGARLPRQSSPQYDVPRLDIDSAQIVNMALNLSESRRLASRRVSRVTPPRLAPVPDGSSGSNLRQHFQQQRRSSRNMSPKPNQAPSPRLSSGARLSSPLQPGFDAGHDGQYRYHFSTSTLSRAQKAKEHLELMAQYRRLLDTLPPLKPGFERRRTTSPPSSPIGNIRTTKSSSQNNAASAVGRQYNPLQYIRNRKVRARERKVIDGERQGFGDVDGVRLWVDKICSHSSSLNVYSDEDEPSVPAFPSADEPEGPTSPDAASRAAARVRRPRVDWFIEPCDMIADAYWLEQEQHKHLIEDRQWRKIFPPMASISRPMSRETDDPSHPIPSFSFQNESPPDARSSGNGKVDSDLSHNSTRHRAKQKLQNIRALPHRHSGSLGGQHHDFVRLKKDFASDLSGSDNDGKNDTNQTIRPVRSSTISSNTNDLLEKQMREMVAKEARERELAEEAFDNEAIGSPPVMTPERNPLSQPPSRFHSRKGSMVDTSDSDRNAAVHDRSWPGSPPQFTLGQQGEDLDDQPPRQLIERFSSLPTSPELRAVGDGAEPVAIANQLSPPWTRGGSPTRNPLSKIKHIMRDRNGDSGNGPHSTEPEQEEDRRISAPDAILPADKTPPPNGRQSSPTKRSVPERQSEPWKMHRSSGSLRLRPDDQGVGLRGIFKGPRLDTVIRGGVSKLGDMLWRKDGSIESTPEPESADESESERARGRLRSSLPLSRKPSKRTQDDDQHPSKHFLDSMPEFHHTPGIHHTRSAGDSHREATPSESANHSRQSSRFDLLKPPRINDRNSSSSASPPGYRKVRLGDSDASESESWHGSVPEGVQGAEKPPHSALAPPGADETGRRQSRHWSIADKGCGTQQARISRREIARMRALILSSGVKAMEINRRAAELHKPFVNESLAMKGMPFGTSCSGVGWADIAKLCPDRTQLRAQQATYCELYPLAASALGGAIQASGQRWQVSADRFTNKTSPELQRRIGDLRSRLVDDLSEMTRSAADEADETSRDLALGQPLKVKHVVDIIEKMLRRRRRRLRWVRRALWLTVEWLLVGFMWYVWFVVMILRVFLGMGKGVWRGVRWLLWL